METVETLFQFSATPNEFIKEFKVSATQTRLSKIYQKHFN